MAYEAGIKGFQKAKSVTRVNVWELLDLMTPLKVIIDALSGFLPYRCAARSAACFAYRNAAATSHWADNVGLLLA